MTYTPSAGTPEDIRAFFESSYQAVAPDGEIVIQSNRPRILVKRADLSQDPVAGDTFAHDGVTYSVYGVEKDGQGGLLIYLHKE